MAKPWIPTKRELPGMALVLVLALSSLGFGVLLRPHTQFISDIIVAILLGALVLNSPLSRWIKLAAPEARDADAYERGLRFTGKWVLRLAIILMGLKVQTDLFRVDQIFIVGSIILFALPTAFFLAHSSARWLGLRQELGDLLSIGTMVCGASAINALSPVIYAHRRDQGLAITAVFLFSVMALIVFYPLAQTLGISNEFGGLWAGLAVNDLSGAVAVGSQFGGEAEVIAAAAKSVRIMLLGPLLIFFAFLRPTARGESPDRKESSWTAHFPLFILGYFLFFGVRVAGDGYWGDGDIWGAFLAGNTMVVKVLILAVCAGIGLQIRVKTIIEVGWKAVLVGACASFGMAGLSLLMLLGFGHEMPLASMGVGLGGLLCSAGLFRFKSSAESTVFRRLEEGAPLSLREAISIFDSLDRQNKITRENCARILRQVYPAIGELQPLRTTELVPPIQYRRLIYWVSPSGSGSLVGILWAPGAEAHIHSHGYDGLGKTIEGRIEDTEFEVVSDGELKVISRKHADPEDLLEFTAHKTIHAVRNPWGRDAIDLHFYGREISGKGMRYDPLEDGAIGEIKVGDSLMVRVSEDILPETIVGAPDSVSRA